MSNSKQKRWKMPEWMEKYVSHFSDTGGWMTPEDAMNCDGKDCNVIVNAPRALLCNSVSAQTRLLMRLYKEGMVQQ